MPGDRHSTVKTRLCRRCVTGNFIPHRRSGMQPLDVARAYPAKFRPVREPCRTNSGRFPLGTRELVIPVSMACASGIPAGLRPASSNSPRLKAQVVDRKINAVGREPGLPCAAEVAVLQAHAHPLHGELPLRWSGAFRSCADSAPARRLEIQARPGADAAVSRAANRHRAWRFVPGSADRVPRRQRLLQMPTQCGLRPRQGARACPQSADSS